MVNKIPLVTTPFNPDNDTKRISLWSGRSVRWRQFSYRDAQPGVRSVATICSGANRAAAGPLTTKSARAFMFVIADLAVQRAVFAIWAVTDMAFPEQHLGQRLA